MLPLLLFACDRAASGDEAPPLTLDDSVVAGDSADSRPPLQALWINEACANNHGTLLDADGEASDWLELYNPGPDSVDLGGWGLDDSAGEPWRLPDLELLPGDFLVVFASGKDRDGAEPHADFKLDRAGETLTLSDPWGRTVHRLELPALDEDRSWGLSQPFEEETLIAPGSLARLAVDAPEGWTGLDFDDAGWTELPLPIGFDRGGGEGPAQNLALFGLTTQSSNGYNRSGVEAVDGTLSTFSHTADGDLSPWWELDLGAPHRLEAVTIFNRLDCCAERLYNLELSLLDGQGAELWRSERLNPTTTDPSSPGERLDLPLDAVAQVLRVEKEAVDGAGRSEWMSLAEVELMGVLAAPYEGRIQGDAAGLVEDRAQLRVPFAAGSGDRALLELDCDDLCVVAGQPLRGRQALALHPELLESGLLTVEAETEDELDFLVDLRLTRWRIETGEPAWFLTPTPGAPNGPGLLGRAEAPTVDHPRGLYDGPFTVTLSSPTEGATLSWTLDGRAPDPAAGVEGPVSLDITGTTVLRALASADGYADSPTSTWTWVFPAEVLRQPDAPAGFPATWDGLSQPAIAADYGMDPEVVEDPAYADDALAGLHELATLSLVMDPDDLFGPDGIYDNSLQRGAAWERAVSVELIEPDGSNTQVDAGVRIHGYGWRPHGNTRKHSLRLEFGRAFGPTKWAWPVFPDAPVERFDSIVLRSQGSRSWQDFRDPEQAQYLRDSFARDTARDMGKVDGHARLVHLYLNGLYWGLYNPVERPDADFAAEYFGGEAADYDAINRRTTTNEAIDGTLDAYNALIAMADAGLSEAADWEAIQQVVDVADLVDYMLIHQYTVNRDGPEIFSSNNMRGVRRRDGGLWRFFVWDMEYTLWEADWNYNIDVDVAGSISHVYAALRQNPEFRSFYAERAHLHLEDGGALTPEACIARYEARAEQIVNAIVDESARWGDAHRATPYTRDVEWAAERERLVTGFFPERTAQLIAQLQAAGLY